MRAIVRILSGQSRRRDQEARIAPHHNINLDPTQGPIVQIITSNGTGDKTRRTAIAWRMIVLPQIIVNRLGDMETTQIMLGDSRSLSKNMRRLGRIISANVEKPFNLMLP